MNILKQHLFGTDGIRGTVGFSPLTNNELIRLGQAIGQWMVNRYGAHTELLIAQDTRVSGNWIGATLSAGLLLTPITLQDAWVLPTPAVCSIVAQLEQMQGGIMISASHNPYQDNGIKIIDATGNKISDEDEAMIERLYECLCSPAYLEFGQYKQFPYALELYKQTIKNFFHNLDLSRTTIVLDCANGATYDVAPSLFSAFGAQVIALNDQPNGRNINKKCGSVYPESLQNAVIQKQATVGFAFDGDGDRVVAVNKYGTLKNGDDLLALLSMHTQYASQATIVGTTMSNIALEDYLQHYKKSLLRTAVGDRWVAAVLEHEQLPLGGEQSGHIIMQDYLPTGDGIATALRVVQSMQQTNNWDMETFTPYPQLLTNIPVTHKKDLKEPTLAAIIAEYEQKLSNGRLSVRYSGTENLLRIMVEAEHTDTVHLVSRQLAQRLKKELQ